MMSRCIHTWFHSFSDKRFRLSSKGLSTSVPPLKLPVKNLSSWLMLLESTFSSISMTCPGPLQPTASNLESLLPLPQGGVSTRQDLRRGVGKTKVAWQSRWNSCHHCRHAHCTTAVPVCHAVSRKEFRCYVGSLQSVSRQSTQDLKLL